MEHLCPACKVRSVIESITGRRTCSLCYQNWEPGTPIATAPEAVASLVVLNTAPQVSLNPKHSFMYHLGAFFGKIRNVAGRLQLRS